MAAKTELKVELQHPLKVGGVEVKLLTLRYPRVRDLRAMGKASKDQTEQGIFLIGTLAELAPEELDELSMADLVNLQEKMQAAGFLGSTPNPA